MANRSGFAQKIKITPENGEEFEVTTHLMDYVRFETVKKRTITADIGISDILWLAWAAGVRTGKISERIFEKWFPTISGFESIADDSDRNQLPGVETDGDTDSDPTQSDPSTEQ